MIDMLTVYHLVFTLFACIGFCFIVAAMCAEESANVIYKGVAISAVLLSVFVLAFESNLEWIEQWTRTAGT